MIALFDVTIPEDGGDNPAVRDLSLRLEASGWHEIVGPSGAGKTALFEVMTLRRRPKRGKLVVAGRNVDRMKRAELAQVRQDLGSCPEEPVLLRRRTAVENAVLPMVVRGASEEAVEAAEEALGFLGVMSERDRTVASMSSQHRALVGLAMATVGTPAVIAIDAVHERLEPAVRGMVLSWLERKQDQGSTVVIFGRRPTNRRAESSVWRMRDGRIEETDEAR